MKTSVYHTHTLRKVLLAALVLLVAVLGGDSLITAANMSQLTAITVSTPSNSVPTTGSRQFTAIGLFSDGTTSDVTSNVTWHVLDTNIGISTSGGLFKALSIGETRVWATYGTVKSNESLVRVVEAITESSGVLYTSTGQPVPAAQIRFYESSGGGLVATVTTDASGAFAIDVPLGIYDIKAYTGSTTLANIPSAEILMLDNFAMNEDKQVNLTLPPVVTLSGRVKDEFGGSVASMNMTVSDRAGGIVGSFSKTVTTTSNGTYSLYVFDGETYDYAFSPPSSYYGAGAVDVTVAGNTNKDITLYLKVTVSGRVYDHKGNAVPNLPVGVGNNWTTTDGAGAYSVQVPKGTYNFSVSTTGVGGLPATVPKSGHVTLKTGVAIQAATAVDLFLPIIELHGYIVNQNGNAVPDISINLRDAAGGSVSNVVEVAKSAANGYFTANLFDDLYTLNTDMTNDYADSYLFNLKISDHNRIGGKPAVVVVLTQKVTLSGRVLNSVGQPIEDVGVYLIHRASGTRMGLEYSAVDGSYSSSVMPGEYDIYLNTIDRGPNGYPLGEMLEIAQYDLGADRNRDLVLLTRTLSGRVTNQSNTAIANATMTVVLPSKSNAVLHTTQTDNAGDYQFTLLPNQYSVTATPPGGSHYYPKTETGIDVTNNATQNFVLAEAYRVTGKVTSNGVTGIVVPGVEISFNNVQDQTDQDGNFEVYLGAGNYSVSLGTSGSNVPAEVPHGVYAAGNLQVSGVTVYDVSLPIHTLQGQVTDMLSQPVNNVELTFSDAEVNNISSTKTIVYTDAGGNYSLKRFEDEYHISAVPPAAAYLQSVLIQDYALAQNSVKDIELLSLLLIYVEDLLPAQNFEGTPNPDATVTLSWDRSPSDSVASYNLYWDNGTGSIDYSETYATIPATLATSYTYQTGPLSIRNMYTFAIRVASLEGNEESNINNVVKVQPYLASRPVTSVRTVITTPGSGLKVYREEALVKAELQYGDIGMLREVCFEYRPYILGNNPLSWSKMNPGHNQVNPATPDSKYGKDIIAMHWDIQGNTPGNTPVPTGLYELRARATDIYGVVDPSPPVTVMQVVDNNPHYRESSGSDTHGVVKSVYNQSRSEVDCLSPGGKGATVSLPQDALLTFSTNLVVQSIADSKKAAIVAKNAKTSLDNLVEISLESGQHNLLNGKLATIGMNYIDDNNDGVVDGTSILVSSLTIEYYNENKGKFESIKSSSVDTAKKRVTGTTDHFSLFGLFGSGSSGSSSSSAAASTGTSSVSDGGSGGCLLERTTDSSLILGIGSHLRDLLLNAGALGQKIVGLYYCF